MPGTAPITLVIVGGPIITVPFDAGINAQQVMERAFDLVNDRKKFDYALEYFGTSLGYLVVMINDTYESFISSSEPFYFWEILVDNHPASTGINHLPLQAGATLTFELRPYGAGITSKSTMHAKYQARLRTS
jgi:hypothetical protein